MLAGRAWWWSAMAAGQEYEDCAGRCDAVRSEDEAMIIWVGNGSFSGRGGRECERDVKSSYLGAVLLPLLGRGGVVVDFSRQRRSTR